MSCWFIKLTTICLIRTFRIHPRKQTLLNVTTSGRLRCLRGGGKDITCIWGGTGAQKDILDILIVKTEHFTTFYPLDRGTLAHFIMSYLSKRHQGHLFEHGGTRVGPPPTMSTSDKSRLLFWVEYKDINSWKVFCQKCILIVFEERLAKYKKRRKRPNGKGAGSQNTKAELKKRDPRTKGLQSEGR